MKQAFLKNFKFDFTREIAFIMVVLAAGGTMLFMREKPYEPLELFIFIGLCLAYTVFCLRGYEWLTKFNRALAVWLYFLIALPLGATIEIIGGLSGAFWILLLPLAGVAVSSAPVWGTVVLCALIVAVQSGIIAYFNNDFDYFAPNALSFTAGVLFIVMFTVIAEQEEKSRAKVEQLAEELHEANQQLRQYAAQVEELATTKERNRLAREIHDSLGHYLTVVNVQIEAARVLLRTSPDKAETNLLKAQTLAREGLAEVRRSVAALRTSPTEGKALTDLLRNLVEETRKTGLITDLVISGEPRLLEPQTEHTLYRAAQEGLTNVRKHANASQVKLCLDYNGGTSVSLQVEDNGVGTTSDENGFGLLGMRERVQLLGGKIQTQSEKGKGFRLEVELPV
jgi:signal transduction histidine kinase